MKRIAENSLKQKIRTIAAKANRVIGGLKVPQIGR